MFITGTWNGSVPAAQKRAPVFAIAINGRVQATARPFGFDGAVHWAPGQPGLDPPGQEPNRHLPGRRQPPDPPLGGNA